MTDHELTAQLKAFIESTGKNAVALGVLAKAGSKIPLLKSLGIRSSDKAPAVKEVLAPRLGGGLVLRKKGPSVYLMLNQPEDEFLLKLLQKGSLASKNLRYILPAAKADDVLSAVNRLLENGKIRVGRVNKEYKAMAFFAAAHGERQNTPASGSDSAAIPARPVSEGAFFKALDEIIARSGKSQARISKLRDRLGWDDGVFDDMVRRLSGAMKIQLFADYLGTLTVEERDRGFIDENGRAKYDVSRW